MCLHRSLAEKAENRRARCEAVSGSTEVGISPACSREALRGACYSCSLPPVPLTQSVCNSYEWMFLSWIPPTSVLQTQQLLVLQIQRGVLGWLGARRHFCLEGNHVHDCCWQPSCCLLPREAAAAAAGSTFGFGSYGHILQPA